MKTLFGLVAPAVVLLLTLASPAAAAEGHGTLFGGYWSGFVNHWQDVFQKQDGIAMAIVGLGIVALFIITRGKWLK
jgi:hypothetical protein